MQPKPKYQNILETLAREILSGHFRPGQKFPSEAALVNRFAVSRITIGRALRELQQRGLVDRIAGSGTYVRGRTKESRRGLVFGLVIPNLGETEIFEPICKGIAGAPEASDHALLWPHTDASVKDREQQALQLCRQCIARKVSGVFFAPLELTPAAPEVNHRILRMLKLAGIPVVLLDRRPEDSSQRERCDLAGIDNHRAGYIATEHLLKLGVRRIGFLAYHHQASTVKARILGYKDALNGTGEPHVFHAPADDHLALSAAARKCEAFVCANDRIAGHLMHTLLAEKLRIPQDVRIVGMDDVGYATLLPVPLTTIHQPCQDIGEAALRVMLERLNKPKMLARDILLDCTLVIRQSCGAAIS